jgi:hypothetical protein
MGIGHAALLRDPVLPTPVIATDPPLIEASEMGADMDEGGVEARLLPEDPAARPALDAADVELALRFLPEASVVALTYPLPATAISAAVEGVAFATARLIVLVPAGAAAPAVPSEATVLEAPPDDDGSFGRLVGTYAGALDAGVDAEMAFREAVTASGWEQITD